MQVFAGVLALAVEARASIAQAATAERIRKVRRIGCLLVRFDFRQPFSPPPLGTLRHG
jgi:hypothetical protein